LNSENSNHFLLLPWWIRIVGTLSGKGPESFTAMSTMSAYIAKPDPHTVAVHIFAGCDVMLIGFTMGLFLQDTFFNSGRYLQKSTSGIVHYNLWHLERQLRWRQRLSCGSRRGYLKRPSAVIPLLTRQSLNSC
jgi:hypothetical protein